MNAFSIFTVFTGSKASFLQPYQGSDDLEAQYNLALSFWDKLEGNAYIYWIIFLAIGILCAYYYYGPFNKMPGRHYHPKFWGIIGGVCLVSTLILTFVSAYLVAPPKIDGAMTVEIELSLGCMVYSAITYLLVSLYYCNYGKTNAYRLLKF